MDNNGTSEASQTNTDNAVSNYYDWVETLNSQYVKNDDFMTKTFSKKVCVDKANKCNFIKPYSYLELLGINPTTNEKYTEKERMEKVKQYDNMCSLSNTEIQQCCDKNDTKLDQLLEKVSEAGQDFSGIKVKKINENNKLVGYEICKDEECGEGFEEVTGYDVCKTNHKDIVKNGNKITNLRPDCYTANCGNANYVPFLRDPYQQEQTYVDDSRLVDAIKKGNLEYVQDHFKELKDYNRVLKAGYPGNTALHEAIIYDADDIVSFFLKNKLDLTIQNKDGNTVLQIASLKGNTTLVYKLIKLGANINDTNKYNDTPLHSAVRSAVLETCVVLLSQGATLFPKNIFGETPLHTAIVSPKKNLKIIIQLVKMGSDLKTRNNNNHSLMKTLSLHKKTKKHEEIRTYLHNIYIKRYSSSYSELIKEDPDASVINMVDKDGKKEDINQYRNLDKISVELSDEYLTDKNLYKSKSESELPTKIKVGKDRLARNVATSSSKEEKEEEEKEEKKEEEKEEKEEEEVETFEQFTNNNSNKQPKNTNLLGEVFDCNKFMYITTAVFVLLLVILLILKYKK